MKLRFSVDQAEAFRRGIDVPKSIVTIDVNPADVDQKTRYLIAERLDGIDVICLGFEDALLDKIPKGNDAGKRYKMYYIPEIQNSYDQKPVLIETASPDLESLIVAIRANEDDIHVKERIWYKEQAESVFLLGDNLHLANLLRFWTDLFEQFRVEKPDRVPDGLLSRLTLFNDGTITQKQLMHLNADYMFQHRGVPSPRVFNDAFARRIIEKAKQENRELTKIEIASVRAINADLADHIEILQRPNAAPAASLREKKKKNGVIKA